VRVKLTLGDLLTCLNLSAGHQHRWPQPYLMDDTSILPSGEKQPGLGHERRLKLMAAYLYLKDNPQAKETEVDFTPAELHLMDESLFTIAYGGAHLVTAEKFFRALVAQHAEFLADAGQQRLIDPAERARQREFLEGLDGRIASA
jgi:hypothetical protein